jgi:hypothetical protein
MTPGEPSEVAFKRSGAYIRVKGEIFGFSLRKERVPFGKSYWIGNQFIFKCHSLLVLEKPKGCDARRLTEKDTV